MPVILASKRDGDSLSVEDFQYICRNIQAIPRQQLGAFLIACQINASNLPSNIRTASTFYSSWRSLFLWKCLLATQIARHQIAKRVYANWEQSQRLAVLLLMVGSESAAAATCHNPNKIKGLGV